AGEPRNRRAVGTANPDSDSALAVEANCPRIAVAVAGAGFKRDAARDRIFGRQCLDEDISHVPSRDWFEQIVPWRARGKVTALDERGGGAEPRNISVEFGKVHEGDANTTEPHRQSGCVALRQYECGTCFLEARRQARGT